jgi:hypothetical protein
MFPSIVINALGLDLTTVLAHQQAATSHKSTFYSHGSTVGLVWSCSTEEEAEAQLNQLWDGKVAARMATNSRQEYQYLLEIERLSVSF